MREAHQKRARNWHASEGSTRYFPVRRDPVASANSRARGGTLSLPRVCSRTASLHSLVYMLAGIVFFVCVGVYGTASAATSDPWTGLKSGRVGDYLWEVKTKRKDGGGQADAQEPCLMVGTTWELGPFNYRRSRYRACAGAEG